MLDMLVLLVLALMLLLPWIILIVCIHVRDNMPIKLEELKQEGVLNTIRRVAINIVKEKFCSEGKPVCTKKGNYRVDFLKAVSAEQKDIENISFKNGELSEDIRAWAYRNHIKPIRRKHVYSIIDGYVRYFKNVQGKRFDAFLEQYAWITPDDFFKVKGLQSGDSVGVYILYNESQEIYYVGQATRLIFRINQHFTGHGNGDVYADYKYGDQFKIRAIRLVDSGYSDLDKLERDLIEKYEAYQLGYNKTKGNNTTI